MPGPNQKGASSAPEIDLDSAGKDSFHSWYRSLPQVCIMNSVYLDFIGLFGWDRCGSVETCPRFKLRLRACSLFALSLIHPCIAPVRRI